MLLVCGLWYQGHWGLCRFFFKSRSWHSRHITALLRGRRRFMDVPPNIKWINQERGAEVVININEVL